MSTPKTTVLLGKGSLAVRVAEWLRQRPEFDLSLIVPVIPEPTWSDSISDWGAEAGVPVVASGNYREIAPDLEIDLAISIFYERIIKADFIDRCGRIVNLHNGPLPRYRGVSPINWALKNGEDHHGVTLHEITPGIDDGPIIAQVIYSIHPEIEEVRDVYARALAYGYQVVIDTLPSLDRIVPRAQDDSLATYYAMGDNERLGDRRSWTRADSVAAGASAH